MPLYTAPASKNFRRGRRDCEKRGSVESRSLVSYLRNCENIDTDCLSIKSDPIGNVFICLTDEQSFFHDRQLLSGTAQNQTKQIGLQTIKRMFFLSSFSVSTENCFHAESGRRNRSVAETRKYKIKILLCFVLRFFLVTAQRCHFTSSVNKTKDYSHRELSRRAYNTYYSNILCLKRSLNCTVCGTCVPLTADAL